MEIKFGENRAAQFISPRKPRGSEHESGRVWMRCIMCGSIVLSGGGVPFEGVKPESRTGIGGDPGWGVRRGGKE